MAAVTEVKGAFFCVVGGAWVACPIAKVVGFFDAASWKAFDAYKAFGACSIGS